MMVKNIEGGFYNMYRRNGYFRRNPDVASGEEHEEYIQDQEKDESKKLPVVEAEDYDVEEAEDFIDEQDDFETTEEDNDPLQKLKETLDRMNENKDSRVNLLQSVQPFLSTSRRGYCKTCINILKLVELIKYYQNEEN